MNDPRQHRHVRSCNGPRITYVCGCVNEVDAASGVLRSASKCEGHRAGQREAGALGQAYYEELGSLRGGVPQCRIYCDQLVEALGDVPDARDRHDLAFEVGPGVSMYAPLFIRRGYNYAACEPSAWAAEWNRNAYRCVVQEQPFEAFAELSGCCSHVLAAHSLEHLTDAPRAVEKCAGMLAPGGTLWVVVPDDEDPLNPDHLWFFTPETLRGRVESAGLEVERLEVRRCIERESFLYLRARKP